MTVKEQVGKIGAIVRWNVQGLMINVIIKDVRQVFNRIDYLISPVSGAGTGENWVASDSVKVG